MTSNISIPPTRMTALDEQELDIPVNDALTRSPERLVKMVLAAFPKLKDKPAANV